MAVKAAQYWADYLHARGVRNVFGLPGTESLELVEAVRKANLQFVTTHHEGTAAFMAAMYGQLTGIPGVCLATRGPGATNLVSGVGAAHLDRMPLLAVTGDHPSDPALPAHQRLPLAEFFAPITRASVQVSAATLPEQLPCVFDATLGDQPGPAFLAFPAPETAKVIDGAPSISAENRKTGEARLPDLAPVLDRIARSERMMIIAGLGIPNANAGNALVKLAERLGCPVADTPQMKGWFPNDHPLYVGTFGTHQDQQVAKLADESDLILTVGLDSVEFLKPWKLTPPVVSLAATEPDSAIPSDLAIRGPLSQMLEALGSEARPKSSWDSETVRGHRCAIMQGIMPPSDAGSSGAMWPQTVIAELQAAMPVDGVVTVDVGSHKLLMVLQWIARQANSFLNSSGLSSMGTGIPFAAAAKMVWSDRPVAAVIGDGGYLMYTGQLEMLTRLNLPIVIVVMADASFYSIKIKQLRREYPPVGTDFNALPIANIAREFGLAGERVTNPIECREAFTRALQADRPTVIEAVIDPSGYGFSQ